MHVQPAIKTLVLIFGPNQVNEILFTQIFQVNMTLDFFARLQLFLLQLLRRLALFLTLAFLVL